MNNNRLHIDYSDLNKSCFIECDEHKNIEKNMVKIMTYSASLNTDNFTKIIHYDCIGRVLDVGEQVENIAIDDWVIAVAQKSLTAVILVKDHELIKKPQHMPIYECVSIFYPFYCAHVKLAKLVSSEDNFNILLYNAINPIGISIIQFALLQGINIFLHEDIKEKKDFMFNLVDDYFCLNSNKEIAFSEFSSRRNKHYSDLILYGNEIAQGFLLDKIDFITVLHDIEENINAGFYQPVPYNVYSKDELVMAVRSCLDKHTYKTSIIELKEIPIISTNTTSAEERDSNYGLANGEALQIFELALKCTSPEIFISKSGRFEGVRATYINSIFSSRELDLTAPIQRGVFEVTEKVKSDMINIWKEVLDIENVSEHDDFFDLGGDSLLAIQLCYKVKMRYGVGVLPNVLLENSQLIKFSTEVMKAL